MNRLKLRNKTQCNQCQSLTQLKTQLKTTSPMSRVDVAVYIQVYDHLGWMVLTDERTAFGYFILKFIYPMVGMA